ncbi:MULTISPECIES: DegT/DnrJ/EryC1/StrS family aminotransferase [Micromonospora]|uniref:DegT/DnrJ/EryC1/StrS family aminotransferase n=1 Tax=Micromonospora TaxID=1873 RepID=UPI00064C0010|nr:MULTISPECIES: DegT/DnrJ/EryC1/StrS family aminotransferase [Micromonospora]MDG4750890.1 DegT/DnrJ/EryC1/StrS family aminotransferase [Micromonospora sp. WMMD718]UFN96869.1 DegT/DnrJ/EryC1/StrS family aminotransferase [Micromonospora aurantiaca]
MTDSAHRTAVRPGPDPSATARVPAGRLPADEAWRHDIARGVERVVASGRFTQGAEVAAFEEELAAYTGVRHALCVSSGTAALQAIYEALGLRRPAVPVNTFAATATAAVRAGGTPVLAPVDANLLLSGAWDLPSDLDAVVVVHVGGMLPRDLADLRETCRTRGMALVEDAAHALGSTADGTHVGALGDAAAVSFYPTKIVTAGEGGAILTDRDDVAESVRMLRDQGKVSSGSNIVGAVGANWRMSEFHAAVGRVSLRRLEDGIARKREVAADLDRVFATCGGISVAEEPSEHRWNRHRYVVSFDDQQSRADFEARLAARHISCPPAVFTPFLHRQPALLPHVDAGHLPPDAGQWQDRHLCLPVHADLTEAEHHHLLDVVTRLASG